MIQPAAQPTPSPARPRTLPEVPTRERLADELRDDLVKQIFSISMELHRALSLIADPAATEKVTQAISGLDQAVTTIRAGVLNRISDGDLGRAEESGRLTPMTKVKQVGVPPFPPALSFSMLMHSDGTARAVVSGVLDVATVAALIQAAIQAVRHGAQRLVLDLTGVTFCDAQGLAAFVQIANRAEAAGGGLTLIGSPPRVVLLLHIAGLDQRFAATPLTPAPVEDTGSVPGSVP